MIAFLAQPGPVEISKDQPNENKHRIVTQSLLFSKEVSHCHLCFGKDSKASRGVEELHSGKKGRLWVCPDWRLMEKGNWRWVN